MLKQLNDNKLEIKNNYEFYKDFNAIKFLREVGKNFRMSSLLNK
jgi:tyrosyl-tRNA synthetase